MSCFFPLLWPVPFRCFHLTPVLFPHTCLLSPHPLISSPVLLQFSCLPLPASAFSCHCVPVPPLHMPKPSESHVGGFIPKLPNMHPIFSLCIKRTSSFESLLPPALPVVFSLSVTGAALSSGFLFSTFPFHPVLSFQLGALLFNAAFSTDRERKKF